MHEKSASLIPDLYWLIYTKRMVDLYQTGWFIPKEWFEEKTLDNRKNGNHKCIREVSEKAFLKLKSQSGAFQLMRCLSGIRPLSTIIVGPKW